MGSQTGDLGQPSHRHNTDPPSRGNTTTHLHSNNNNSCPSTERLKAANQREGLKVGTSVRSPLRDLLDTFLFYPRPSWSGWQSKVLAK